MKRDILFLVRGIPEAYHIVDDHYFMATPTASIVQKLGEISKMEFPVLESFLRLAGNSTVSCVGFRNDFEDENGSVTHAFHQLAGIIDGLSFLLDEVPTVAEIVQIREGNTDDVKLCRYYEDSWINFGDKTSVPGVLWQKRSEDFLQHLVPFFEIAGGDDPSYETDICAQLQYSAKMFRHGAQAKTWGIQYLSKFSALEGLVCGDNEAQKYKLLSSRLSKLFKHENDIAPELLKLWKLRCSASHQAKAFHTKRLSKGTPLQIEIEAVEYYFFGAFAFALDHVRKVKSTEELWSCVESYELPQFAVTKRPHEIQRLPASSILIQSGVSWHGVGRLFDSCFENNQKRRPV